MSSLKRSSSGRHATRQVTTDCAPGLIKQPRKQKKNNDAVTAQRSEQTNNVGPAAFESFDLANASGTRSGRLFIGRPAGKSGTASPDHMSPFAAREEKRNELDAIHPRTDRKQIKCENEDLQQALPPDGFATNSCPARQKRIANYNVFSI